MSPAYTVAGLARFIGEKILVRAFHYSAMHGRPADPGILVPAYVLNVRMVFGKPSLLVLIPHGVGTTWISLDRVEKIVDDWPQVDENAMRSMVGREYSDSEREEQADVEQQ